MIGVFHTQVLFLSFEHSLLKVSLHCILIGLGNTLDESYLRIGPRVVTVLTVVACSWLKTILSNPSLFFSSYLPNSIIVGSCDMSRTCDQLVASSNRDRRAT